MTEAEYHAKTRLLNQKLRIAKSWVYYGQPEKTKAAAYELLRQAEDALRLHLDNKRTLIS